MSLLSSKRLILKDISENDLSCKLLEKFNFKKEGILRHWTYVDDIFYDSYSYSLILSDFEDKIDVV